MRSKRTPIEHVFLTSTMIATLSACVAELPSTGTVSQGIASFGEWSAPVNVGAPINSPYNDSYAFLTRDGLTMYFTSDRPGGHGSDDLWVSHREARDAPWQEPENLDVLNSAAADSLAVLSSDGTTMFFASTRPGCGLSDLWTSRLDRATKQWSAPENLGCVVNTGFNENAPALYEGKHHVTTLYFGSNRPGGVGDFDIYQSTSTDKDLANASFGPGVLVRELSSPKRDTRTFVRRDGLEIFITSDRDGGFGLIDLWVATRAHTSSPWGVPVNLGGVVNSVMDDGSPALSHDGTTMHFFSNRAGGLGLRDIYYTTRTRLDDGDDEHEDD